MSTGTWQKKMSNNVTIHKKAKSSKEELIEEIHEVIKSAWGGWSVDYIESHILTSDFLAFAYAGNKLVGFSSARKFDYAGKNIYYFEFLAIKKNYQGRQVSVRLNKHLFKRFLVDSFFNLKKEMEVMAISPNPRILGSFMRTADFVYPNPLEEEKEASDYVWDRVEFLVKELGDPYTKLEKNGSVIEGFYESGSDLIYNKESIPKDKDDRINNYAEKKLMYNKRLGREFVIYANYSLFSVLKKLAFRYE